MSLKKLVNITPAELKAKGVVSLADRPNVTSSYGTGGLSPTQLKLWFDQLATFLAEKLNMIQDTLSGEDAASYLKLDLSGLYPELEGENFSYSLQDLCDSFIDGKFASFLKLYESASASDLKNLQTIINEIAQDISDENEALQSFKELLLSKNGAANIGLPDIYDTETGKKLSDFISDIFNCNLAAKIVIETYGFATSNKTAKVNKTLQTYINEVTSALQAQNSSVLLEMINDRYTKAETDTNISQSITTAVNNHNTNSSAHSAIMAEKFDKANVMPEFVGEDVNNSAKVASAAALKQVIDDINASIESVDGKADVSLKNVTYNSTTGVIIFTKTNGETITYDLPSEKILKSGASYYESSTKKLHLVLMDDSEIVIDVSNLVDEYFGDDLTIESYSENGQKHFRIKTTYKNTLDGYGTTLEDHAEELERLETAKINKTDIVDNLTSDVSDKPVSAKQAKILKDEISSIDGVLDGAFCGAEYNQTTGSLILHKTDGSTTTINFPLESFVQDASFNTETNVVTLVVKNGQSVSFDLSALIDYYYGDGSTIEVYDDPEDNYKHKIRVKSDFLNQVNADISALETRMDAAEETISYLEKIDEYGSIGIADGETITMDMDTGDLSARKLKMSDGTVVSILPISKTSYDALATKDANTLYIIDDSGKFVLAFGSKTLFAGGVNDTETGESITFRFITQSAYEGLATKDSSKLYIINKNGSLAFAFGSLYLDTNSELITEMQTSIDELEAAVEKNNNYMALSHSTLSGESKVILFSSLSATGLTLTTGTLLSSERCLQC